MMDFREIELDVRRWFCRALAAAGYDMHEEVLRAEVRYCAERCVHELVVSMQVPGQVLTEHRLIAEYPATLWGYVARRLQRRLRRAGFERLADRVRWRAHQVFLDEFLAYPTVQVPPRFQDKVRLMIATPTRTAWAGSPWEDVA